MTNDGGRWLRRQCLLMSRTNHTPIGTWLDMPLTEFMDWIDSSNEIAKAAKSR